MKKQRSAAEGKANEEVAAAMASAMTSAAYAEPPSAVGSYLV